MTTLVMRSVARPSMRRRPWGPLAGGTAVVAVVLTPLAFLLVEASSSGTSLVWHLIWRSFTGQLLWNTVRLSVVVTATCAIVGTFAAWAIERTNVPGRRVLAVLVVVPFAIPDFVVAFGWSSLFPSVRGFGGAVLVMTLGVYPLVYLPVAASLRSADPALEETARSLGLGRVATFARVTLPQIRGALAGGAVLVALVVLAEFGAFEILNYQTFTTEIYGEIHNFSIAAACALSLVLIAVGIVLLGTEVGVRGRGGVARVGAGATRARRRHELGPWRPVILLALLALVAAALAMPIASCVYWIVSGPPATLASESLLASGWHTAYYSGLAAALTTVMALPLALLAVRHDSVAARLLERVSYLVLAVPGVVVALALGYFSLHFLGGAGYQSTGMLVLAYAVMFFPLALVGVKASVSHAPARLEEAARSLGVRRSTTFVRVTLPLVGPGLAAAFCLVFLSCVTELTATTLLVPLGAQTLSTEFFAMQSQLSYGQAAPLALVMIVVAAAPSYVLARFFDRRPVRTAGAA